MLGSLLGMLGGKIGAGLGGLLGGGILSRVGRYFGGRAGRALGGKLYQKWFYEKQHFQKFANFHDSFNFTSARYGLTIPLVFGKMRVAGKIIWLNKVTQQQQVMSVKQLFKHSERLKITQENIQFNYYLSFAVAICEGEISSIGRIWHGDELIDIGKYKYRLHKGSENQMPDPLISSIHGSECPAFRDLAYIVFEELPLADFDHTIPNFSFEVTRKAQIGKNLVVEDMVKSMVMIPGSGEYVYDTLPQKKTILAYNGMPLEDVLINVHNPANIADAVYSLDQLQSVCSSVEWVAPVVCWFGNSINAGECLIRPAVEFKDSQVRYDDEWRVGGFTRNNAIEISKNRFNSPNYGGSINDASVIRYLDELKKRHLKILFYPMFFIDKPDKPWRGWLTGSPSEVRDFFTKQHGYNQFILHYANLVKGKVDAFVIGSELVNLTKVKDGFNRFPAVEELVKLAAEVKNILGPSVKITYAADWSEYHHTDGGWFNLDPLWSSPNIDFIGIDAYFPVTNTNSSNISNEEIQAGFKSGEGYDYYIEWNNNNSEKKPLSPEYAWKNIKYWWENQHRNPDGNYTNWVPRSKKIWFTEFGFPSIDKSPNQPNVFFDPNCRDGGMPRYSNGETDFSIQRRSIRAFIEYWQQEEYIEQMFLWTWDARPYPAWPHMNVWADSYLWEKGHWVNNKFGASSIAAIILELSKRANIPLELIDVNSIDEAVEGFIVNTNQNCLEIINTLRTSHFFEINSFNSDKIQFIKRGLTAEIAISKDELVKQSQTSYLASQEISQSEIISKINLHYINNLREYEHYFAHVNDEKAGGSITEDINIPLALSPQEAERIGNLILHNAATENRLVDLILPIEYLHVIPGNYLVISVNDQKISLRVLAGEIEGLTIRFSAILDNPAIYSQFNDKRMPENLPYDGFVSAKLKILELPFYLPGEMGNNLVIFFAHIGKAKLMSRVSNSFSDIWDELRLLNNNALIGKLSELNQNARVNTYLIDNTTKITIRGVDLDNLSHNNWYVAKLGNEYIRFKNFSKIGNGLYKIAYLTRGEFGSEIHIGNHQLGEDFIVLNIGYNLLAVSEAALNLKFDFKAGEELVQEVVYKAVKYNLQQSNFTARVLNPNQLEIIIKPQFYMLDSWREMFDLSVVKYSIKLVVLSTNNSYEFETKDSKYIANISGVDLSGGYEITIMSMYG